MTHDLFTDVLGTIGAEIVQIAVTDLRDNTFYARITLRRDGATFEIDSRPSDAIALAVRCDAPIFAADDVIEASAIQMEDEGGGAAVEGSGDVEKEIQGFREFLENVPPRGLRRPPAPPEGYSPPRRRIVSRRVRSSRKRRSSRPRPARSGRGCSAAGTARSSPRGRCRSGRSPAPPCRSCSRCTSVTRLLTLRGSRDRSR